MAVQHASRLGVKLSWLQGELQFSMLASTVIAG
jgi:hypothetical protein